LRRTLSLDPRHAGALVNLGNRLKDGDRVEAALTCYRKALAIEPGRPESWFNWASANHAAGEIDGAIAGYRRAIARDPRHAWRLRLATLLPPMPRSLADIQTWRDRFAREVAALAAADLRVTDPVADCHWTNFYLAYHDLDDRLLQEAASRLMTLSCPTISAAPTLRRRAGKRRLALVSAYFREHTIGHLFRGVVEAIDRDRFAVAVVQVGPADDRMSRSLANAADEHVVLPLDLADAQRLLAERQLDAVLYTDIGMDPATYYLAHARLAGLQMATWGHPVTTGIASVDWFVSAEGYDAPAAERHYSERLVRLSELLLCYRPISIAWTPADRLRLGFESGRRAYFCAQSLFKIHPRFDRMLTDILARDSDAVLYFIEGHRRPWCDLLRRRLGVHRRDAAARMRFLPRLSADDFVRAMAVADVVLDTPGFSGGKTSLECLSTGTPVVTLPSRFLRGRLTYGFYERLGIRDAVAASDFEYVDLAVGLATDAERRRSLGARIVAAMPRLYGTVAPVREFERLVFEATA
jgi:predicted O-linked N-acetylglucosamine transferase (SPINDLY family)